MMKMLHPLNRSSQILQNTVVSRIGYFATSQGFVFIVVLSTEFL